MIAADWQHAGVQHLAKWSRYLWEKQAAASDQLCTAERHAIAVLCGALLVSVPED